MGVLSAPWEEMIPSQGIVWLPIIGYHSKFILLFKELSLSLHLSLSLWLCFCLISDSLSLSTPPPGVLGLFYSETMCSCGYRSWNNAITSWVTIPPADHEWTAWCKPCQWEGCPERPVLLPVCTLLETSAEAVAFWGFSKSILQANFKYNFQNGFEG